LPRQAARGCCDKTRPSRIAPFGPEISERVVALTLAGPRGETTHWTADMMAAAAGISASAVRRIWKAHGIQPHRWRALKLSNDPRFVAKLKDVVGLYIDPPTHAIVLSVNEKSQIQALDRTQPGLPLKKWRLGTMTHDYKRHGTPRYRPKKPCTSSSTIIPPTSIPRCAPGSTAISAPPSTSRRPRARGSTPWRDSSPSCRSDV